MHPHLTLITLGVTDLERSLAFYRDTLGWPAKSQDDVVFIPLQNGIILSLYDRAALAKDANVSPAGTGFAGITLAHNVASPEEADTIFAKLRHVNVRIPKPPQKAFWGGYSGYFTDPDGYPWEVAWNPFWKLNADGSAELPRP